VTIDGTTQTAFTGDTNPEGWEVAINGIELYLNVDNCMHTEIDSTNITFTGSGESLACHGIRWFSALKA